MDPGLRQNEGMGRRHADKFGLYTLARRLRGLNLQTVPWKACR